MARTSQNRRVARFRAAACLSSICLFSMAGRAYADQPTLFVVDSVGKTVGAVIEEGLIAFAVKPGLVVRIDARYDGIGVIGDEYFTTADCSGPTYLLGSGLLKHAFLDPTRTGKIIFPDADATAITVTSYKRAFDGVCAQVEGAVKAFPTRSASLSDRGFTPPFSVKLQ